MSAFRALASSAPPGESSSSSPAKLTPSDSVNGGNSGASGLPIGGGEGGGAGDAGSGGDGGQRKRRNAGTVSQMACTPCRTARQRVRELFLGNSAKPTAHVSPSRKSSCHANANLVVL